MPHVALEREAHHLGGAGGHLVPGPLLHLVEGDEGLVADYPGQGQTFVGRRAVVIFPAVEVRVVVDGADLLEVVYHLQGRGPQPGGYGDHEAHPVGVTGGGIQAHHAPHASAHHGMEPLHPKVIEQPEVGPHGVPHRHPREGRSVGPAGLGVDAGRPGGPVAMPQPVGADDRELVGVEGTARSDERIPPPDVHLLGPTAARPGTEGL